MLVLGSNLSTVLRYLNGSFALSFSVLPPMAYRYLSEMTQGPPLLVAMGATDSQVLVDGSYLAKEVATDYIRNNKLFHDLVQKRCSDI